MKLPVCECCGHQLTKSDVVYDRIAKGANDIDEIRRQARALLGDLADKEISNILAELVRRKLIRSVSYGRYETLPTCH
jgi:hypothetical protein